MARVGRLTAKGRAVLDRAVDDSEDPLDVAVQMLHAKMLIEWAAELIADEPMEEE